MRIAAHPVFALQKRDLITGAQMAGLQFRSCLQSSIGGVTGTVSQSQGFHTHILERRDGGFDAVFVSFYQVGAAENSPDGLLQGFADMGKDIENTWMRAANQNSKTVRDFQHHADFIPEIVVAKIIFSFQKKTFRYGFKVVHSGKAGYQPHTGVYLLYTGDFPMADRILCQKFRAESTGKIGDLPIF